MTKKTEKAIAALPKIKFAFVISCFFLTGCNQQVQNNESSQVDIDTYWHDNSIISNCTSIENLTSENTFTDIASSLYFCIEEKKYSHAANLYFTLNVYGEYDKNRVENTLTHQASDTIIYYALENIMFNNKESEKFQYEISTEEKKSNDFCQKIEKLGKPSYYPSYMVNYDAENHSYDDANNGLINNFNSENIWNEILIGMVGC